MTNLKSEEKRYLLDLARNSISHYLKTNKKLIIDESELPSDRLKDDRGVFVTLTLNNQLRGCIGHILPVQALYKDVIDTLISSFDA